MIKGTIWNILLSSHSLQSCSCRITSNRQSDWGTRWKHHHVFLPSARGFHPPLWAQPHEPLTCFQHKRGSSALTEEVSPSSVPAPCRSHTTSARGRPLQASTSSTVPLSELVWLWSLGGRRREAVMKMNGFLAVTPSKRLLLALVGTPAVTASYTDGDFAWNTRMTCGHEWAVSLADTFPFLIP